MLAHAGAGVLASARAGVLALVLGRAGARWCRCWLVLVCWVVRVWVLVLGWC